MAELFLNSIKMLLRKKGRTFLTLLGIIVGVASVILINHISRSGNNAFVSEVDSLGMGGLTVTLKNQSAPLNADQLSRIRQLPEVESAMPLMFESTEAVIRNSKNPVFLWGLDRGANETINLQLIHGRFLSSADISSAARTCMIDQTLARSCFGTDKVSGKVIRLNSGSGGEYRIVGVIKTGSGLLQNMMGSYIPNFVYLPYTTMQNNLNSKSYSQIAVKLKSSADSQQSSAAIIRTLERSSHSPGAYTVTDLSRQKDNISRLIGIFSLILTCVGVISLFVAGLSIMNVMLVSVSERKREIGIKKALGAPREVIILEFLSEALILTLTGSVCGIIAGTLIAAIGASILGLTLQPSFDIIIPVIIFSMVIGAVFGIYPAWKASRLRPVDALRSY